MNNIFIRVYYESIGGGTNNLQVAEVYQATPKGDRTIKRFTSKKAKALDSAKRFIKKLNK